VYQTLKTKNMKTIKKIALALSLVTAFAVINSFTFAPSAHASSVMVKGGGGVSDDMVIQYLESFGYTDVVVRYWNNDGNAICSASDLMGGQYTIIVYVVDGQIVEHEEQE
jgi:hypothetical protein